MARSSAHFDRNLRPALEADLVERALRGGFPEAVARGDPERRRAWFRSYVTTVLERDVHNLAQIEGLADLPRLLNLAEIESPSQEAARYELRRGDVLMTESALISAVMTGKIDVRGAADAAA